VQTVALGIPLLYTISVMGVCAYLLSRGITHVFIILFAVGAMLRAFPTIGILLFQQAPGGIAANMRWFSALSMLGMLGAVLSAAAFLSLAVFLLRTQPTEI
jgi:hypothetical protein